MKFSSFKIKLITTFEEIGFDIKALRDWKETLIADSDTTTSSIWSSTKVKEELDKKVDTVLGKGLSDTNYTQAEKDKLSKLENSKFTGIKGSAEDEFRIGDVNIEVKHFDAGAIDPLNEYTTARDN